MRARERLGMAAIGAATCICFCLAIGIALADGPTLSSTSRGSTINKATPSTTSASGLQKTKSAPAAMTRERGASGGNASISPVPIVPTPPGAIRYVSDSNRKTLPAGAEIRSFGSGDATPRAGIQVYLNDNPDSYYGPGMSDPADLAIGDDLVLAGADRVLYSFSVMVACTEGTGTYDVTAGFYENDVGCVGALIAGSEVTWTEIPIDASSFYILSSGIIETPPTLTDVVFLVLTFTNPAAGWATTGQAEVGSTNQFFDLLAPPAPGTWGCSWSWTDGTWGGFYAEVYCTGGPGACCTGDSCEISTYAECTGTFFPTMTCTPNPCCDLSCTPTETEPCGSDSNGGCDPENPEQPPAVTPIVCDTEVCGTYYSTDETQDTDWYQITTTQETVFTFRVQGELPTRFGMIEYTPGFEGSGNCADITGTISPFGLADPCEAGSIRTACLPAGTYWFFVAPADWQPWPCTKYYTALLTCTSPCPIEDPFESEVQMTVELFDPPGTKVLNLQSVCRDDLGVVYRQPPPYTTGTDIDTELGFFAVRGTDPVDPDLGRILLTESYGTSSLGKITDVVASGGNFVSGDSFFDVYVDMLLIDAVPQALFSGVGPFHVVADDLAALPPYTRTYSWVGTGGGGGCMGDANNSGAVSGLDIQGFVDCAIGNDGPEDHCALADMDCSGMVDVADIDEFVTALLAGACGTECPGGGGIELIPDGETEPIGLITEVSHTITQNVCWDALWNNGRANGDNALNAERRPDGSIDRWVVDDVNFAVTTTIQSIHWCVTEDSAFNWAGTVDIGIWAETDGGGDLPPMSAPLYQLLDVPATRTGVVSHGQMCYEVNTSITLPPLTDRSYFIGVRPVQNLPVGGQSFWWATTGLTGQAIYFDDGTGTGWQPSATAFESDYDVSFCIKGVEGAPFPTGACCYLSGGSYTCDATGNVVECVDLGGTYMGDGTTCTFGTCQGACCYTDFTTQGNPYQACAGPVTLAQCVAIGDSVFMGPGSSCASDPCVQPTGSCCYGDANCQLCEVLTALECEAKTDYIAWGEGGTCTGDACFPACGACCEGGTDCSEGTEDDCFAGIWNLFLTCSQAECGMICGEECPVGAHTELEACGADINGGCNSTPPVFENIPFPATNPLTICGSAKTTVEGETVTRDMDWYKFTLTGSSRTVTVTAEAAYPLVTWLLYDPAEDCVTSTAAFATTTLSSCETPLTSSNVCCLPGTYYLVVASPFDEVEHPLPCFNYRVTISATDSECPTGACCVDEVCVATNEEGQCSALGGSWYLGENCTEFSCPSCGTLSKTQSTVPTTVVDGTIECAGGSPQYSAINYFARAFTPAQLGTGTGRINFVRCVDFGVQDNYRGDWPVVINLYRDTNGGAPNTANLVLLGSTSYMVPSGATLQMYTAYFPTPVDVSSVTGSTTLVVEFFLASRDPADGGDGGALWIGTNNLGQSAQSYLKSADCSVPDYVTYTSIGFPNVHLIQVVHGSNLYPP